jgi:hypothetical protein
VTLEDIVTQLNERKQRGTYGAVAKLIAAWPRWLMKGIERSPKYSGVVAKRTGSPTGYAEWQIDPDRPSQIRDDPHDVIKNGDILKGWLEHRTG